MSSAVNICVICAWRVDCQKKFKVSGRDINCPDFARDLSLPKDEEDTGIKREEKEKKDT